LELIHFCDPADVIIGWVFFIMVLGILGQLGILCSKTQARKGLKILGF
jgi:hypothetical protein